SRRADTPRVTHAFFFQAEDGIRDFHVTGVQTCALPILRLKLDQVVHGTAKDEELQFLEPLFALQRERSFLPDKEKFLIEYFETTEGYHVILYPFEGRFVHEGLGALVAYRIAQIRPITFSIAMNDYGFELLSDQPIPIE